MVYNRNGLSYKYIYFRYMEKTYKKVYEKTYKDTISMDTKHIVTV